MIKLSIPLSLLLMVGCAARQTPVSPVPAPLRGAGLTPGSAARTVVFIHGMFVTPRCWQAWETYFQARGYRTVAPAWPEHERPISEQRHRHPSPALAQLTLEELVRYHREVIKGLDLSEDQKPILIGHSMGGLVVQLLLQEGIGAAGVAIDSAPPKGVISLRWSFLRSNWPAISPFASLDEPISMSPAAFAYAFTNTLSPAEQAAAYEEHIVPESRRVGKGPTTAAGAIDFRKPRPPLLLIAGEQDRIIPASLNRKNYERYQASPALTSFQEFPGRDHWLLASTGWQEVADYALAWLAAP